MKIKTYYYCNVILKLDSIKMSITMLLVQRQRSSNTRNTSFSRLASLIPFGAVKSITELDWVPISARILLRSKHSSLGTVVWNRLVI